MSKHPLRDEARGRGCQIRIPSVCNGNPETTVLCHIHKPSISGGMGLKGKDTLAAWGCSECHDAVDGRNKWRNIFSDDDLKLWHYEGVFRTQKILIDEGKL